MGYEKQLEEEAPEFLEIIKTTPPSQGNPERYNNVVTAWNRTD